MQTFACELLPHLEALKLFRRYEIDRMPRILNWNILVPGCRKKTLDNMHIWVQKRPDGECNTITPIIPTVDEIQQFGLSTTLLDGQNVLGVVVEKGVEDEDEDEEGEEDADDKSEIEKFFDLVMKKVEDRFTIMEANMVEKFKSMEAIMVEKFESTESKINDLQREVEILKKRKNMYEQDVSDIGSNDRLQDLAHACEDQLINQEGKESKEEAPVIKAMVPYNVNTSLFVAKIMEKHIEDAAASVAGDGLGGSDNGARDGIPTDVSNVVEQTIKKILHEDDTSVSAGIKRPLSEEVEDEIVSKKQKEDSDQSDGYIFTYPDDFERVIDNHSKGFNAWLKRKKIEMLSSDHGDIVDKKWFKTILDKDGWLTSDVSITRLFYSKFDFYR